VASKESTKLLRIFKLIQYLDAYPAKSIDKLARLLDVSLATMYRYIPILKEVGYDIEVDDESRYSLKLTSRNLHFEENEKKYITAAIKSNSRDNVITNSILSKLQMTNLLPDPALMGELKHIRQLTILFNAIEYKTPIILINYRTTTEGSAIRNRTVLPIHFDEIKMSVTALELSTNECKIFKYSRIEDLALSNEQMNAKTIVNLPMIDIFGYGGKLDINISLLLTKRAKYILTEEFPAAQAFVTEVKNGSDYLFSFSAFVSGYEGVGRFVCGLLNEIIVTGNDGFKEYLRKKLNSKTILID